MNYIDVRWAGRLTPVTPRSEEPPTAVTVRGLGDQAEEWLEEDRAAGAGGANEPPLDLSASTPHADAERKTFATLQALAALRGYRLERIGVDDGGPAFMVSRWGYTAELLSLADVRDFLEQAGGAT